MKNPQVDAYIEKAAPFARPILEKLRAIVHRACPEVAEAIKWRCPSFEYHGLLCGFAAFKKHVTFGFWRDRQISDPGGILKTLGRLTDPSQVPAEENVAALLRQAMKLNESGAPSPMKSKKPKPPVTVPPYFRAALAKNPKARATFDAFPPSHKREYVEWIVEAKQAATRERRIATALEWLAEGKSRNWKYEGQ